MITAGASGAHEDRPHAGLERRSRDLGLPLGRHGLVTYGLRLLGKRGRLPLDRLHLADRRHSLAEEGRRRALLADGLGTSTDELALRDLRVKFSKGAEQTAPAHEDASYYASDATPGPARLRAAMQESAFWSRHLYGAAAKAAGLVSGILLVLVLVALLIVIGTNSANATVAVARIGVLFLSFLVFSDFATQALSWFEAAAKSNDVYLRLQAEDLEGVAAALAVFGDYSVATATTPPIPTVLYKQRHDHIEKAWRAGDQSLKAP